MEGQSNAEGTYDLCDPKTLDDGTTVWVTRAKRDGKAMLGVAYEQPGGGTAFALVDQAVRTGEGAIQGKSLRSLPVTVKDLARLVQRDGLALPLSRER